MAKANKKTTPEEMSEETTSEEMSKPKEETPLEEKGITETLFPDMIQVDEEDTPLPTEEVKEEVEVDAETLSSNKKTEEKVTLPDKSDDEQLITVNIDGEEKQVTLEELKKGYQIDKHLTQKGQELFNARKLFEADQKKTQENKQHLTQQTEADIDPEAEYEDPAITTLRKELADLKASTENLKAVTGPMQYKTDLSDIDAAMKKDGFDDFMDYVPKIENKIFTASPEEQAELYSFNGFRGLYQQFKMMDMQEKINNPAPTINKEADERPRPKVVPIESAGGKSTAADDSMTAINVAMEKAKMTGDWVEVLRLKGL